MILSTLDTAPGKVIEVKGIVHAGFTYAFIDSATRKSFPKKPLPSLLSFLRFIQVPDGNAVDEYAYREVDERLKQKAEELGANAILSVCYNHSVWVAKIMAHGTAVVVELDE